MYWAKEVSTDATDQYISTANAKAHLKVDISDDDALIDALVVASSNHIEEYLGRTMVPKTLKLYMDGFPFDGRSILLPDSPTVSITSVEYVDGDGTTQVWDSSNYSIDLISIPARLSSAYNVSYPSTRSQNNSVIVTYVAGYTVTNGVTDGPAAIEHAAKLMLGSLYDIRENDCPAQFYSPSLGFKTLLAPYRVYYRGPWV